MYPMNRTRVRISVTAFFRRILELTAAMIQLKRAVTARVRSGSRRQQSAKRMTPETVAEYFMQ